MPDLLDHDEFDLRARGEMVHKVSFPRMRVGARSAATKRAEAVVASC